MIADTVLRATAALISVLAVAVIWREHHPPHRLTRGYILTAIIMLAGWRVGLFITTDINPIYELAIITRRVIGPHVAIAMSFALVLAVRSHE